MQKEKKKFCTVSVIIKILECDFREEGLPDVNSYHFLEEKRIRII